MPIESRILPAHIEETIQAIAKLHADHRLETSSMQHLVDRLTALIGRPECRGVLSVVVFAWIAGNLAFAAVGATPIDAPPFNYLQGAAGLLGLFVAALILTTQRRADELASYRDQLTLELSILSEQKSAKIIELLEEMRRDDPHIKNRVDKEAADMAVPSDPQAVFDAIREAHDPASDGQST